MEQFWRLKSANILAGSAQTTPSNALKHASPIRNIRVVRAVVQSMHLMHSFHRRSQRATWQGDPRVSIYLS